MHICTSNGEFIGFFTRNTQQTGRNKRKNEIGKKAYTSNFMKIFH